MRTAASVVVIAFGAVIFARDPSDFSMFSYCGLAGTTIVAGLLFLIGVAIWLRE